MGLDVSHDCWSGAYSAFSRWRERVAQAAGYGIRKFTREEADAAGAGWLVHIDTVDIEWGPYTEDNIMGIWDETPDDPLLVLIVHSDCEGHIYPAQQLALADRLEGLRDHPFLAGTTHGHLNRQGGYRGVIDQFVTGLRDAHSRGERVRFY